MLSSRCMSNTAMPHLTLIPLSSLQEICLYKTWALHLIAEVPAKLSSSSGMIMPGKSTALLSSSSVEKPDPAISVAFIVTSFLVKGCVKIISGDGDNCCLVLR